MDLSAAVGLLGIGLLVAANVGRIEAEEALQSDVVSGPRPRPAPDGSFLLDGLTRLPELEELVGLRLDKSAHEAVDTVGGLMMLHRGRVPAVGDEAPVEELDGRRVGIVRLAPTRESSELEPAGSLQ